jgi:hypothetical protein
VKPLFLAAGAHADEIPEQIRWSNTAMSEAVFLAFLDVKRSIADPVQRMEHRTRLF